MSDTDVLLEHLLKLGAAEGVKLGKIVAIAPLAQDEIFNFTLPKGKGTGLWFSMVYWLGNKGYDPVIKIDETLDISHVDQGYYNLTQRQKDDLEGKIKQGLASAAQAISDYELISHDYRKYLNFLKMLETGDEHSLRATFMDEVDISTGNNAIKTMVVRWPTMISDFLKFGDKKELNDLVDANKISKQLNISRAEAVMLSTKQRLYLNWKAIFGPEVRKRCERIIALKGSREMAMKEYKEWLKPIVAKHKMLKESLSKSPSDTAFSPYSSPGQAMSTNNLEIWGWQTMQGIVSRKGTMEMTGDFGVEPYDKFTKEHVVLADKVKIGGKTYLGVRGLHPWITEEWASKAAERAKKTLKGQELYYAFLRMKFEKVIIKMPDGSECEDIIFIPKMYFFSQNAVVAMLIHYEALKQEFDDYVDRLIGITTPNGEDSETELNRIIEKWKNSEKSQNKESGEKPLIREIMALKQTVNKNWKLVSDTFGFDFSLSRNGPYEHNFFDRIATPYLATEAGDFYVPLTSFLKDGAGVGK